MRYGEEFMSGKRFLVKPARLLRAHNGSVLLLYDFLIITYSTISEIVTVSNKHLLYLIMKINSSSSAVSFALCTHSFLKR